MREMTIGALASYIADAQFPVFVCGAGISFGAAPLAQDLEDGLVSGIATFARAKHPDLPSHALVSASTEIRRDYLTLELLASFITYRVPRLKPVLKEIYEDIFRLRTVNRANTAIANAFGIGKPAAILTANFDDGLYQALNLARHKFNPVTDRNVRGKLAASDICAFHGTVYDLRDSDGQPALSPPTSMTARELAHPFIPGMANYIESAFESADRIFFIGYRGEDFYDLNLAINAYIAGSASAAERVSRRAKFYCIPHRGDVENVSDFVRTTFPKENLIALNNVDNDWLSRVCDLIANKKSIDVESKPVTSADIERRFVEIARRLNPNWDKFLDVVSVHCRLLIEDIDRGVLAVWSVTEHYRLESLGLTQTEIGEFGRPPQNRFFLGVPLAKINAYQRDYWDFNRALRDLKEQGGDRDAVFVKAYKLYNDLAAFSDACLETEKAAERAIDKACCLLMSAITLDYMGLIASRLRDNEAIARRVSDIQIATPDSDILYRRSWETAERAGTALAGEDGLAPLTGPELTEYTKALGQIVTWEIWSIAPRENYARAKRPLLDKINMLSKAIRYRMKKIEEQKEAAKRTVDSMDFSVSGHAAQCVQRISELLRALGNVCEEGIPNFSGSKDIVDDKGRHLPEIVADEARHAQECLEVATRSSSHKNQRFASAYDALVLAALFRNDVDEAERKLREAKAYAGSRNDIMKRVYQIRTRIASIGA